MQIYKTTNLTNGKWYIGKDETDSQPHPNMKWAKGMGWKLINGKRIWFNKEIV